MKRALRDRWAAALEGGKFTQGTGSLRDWYNKTCCLGVLADLYNPDLWMETGGDNYGFGSLNNRGELPAAVRGEIGLSRAQQDMFIKMNDSLHYSFERIAHRVRMLEVED